ncbi:hypothetical protein [Helicobacter bilis]|uniref:hypothetical protein n=1 Tax=Helicobacter bilis TaxID=37372 RepID=UPI002941CC69|nr:hypothetical protein [Helicobacter bilis]
MLKLSALGMSLKRTGFHFDVRLEKSDGTIKYFKKNEKLSFEPLSEYSQMDSSNLDSMDYHDFANAKSRNDKGKDADSKAESAKESDSKILQENMESMEIQNLDSGLTMQGEQETKAEAVEMRKQGKAEVSLVNATPKQKITHTLIIGDNYPALLNLTYKLQKKSKGYLHKPTLW